VPVYVVNFRKRRKKLRQKRMLRKNISKIEFSKGLVLFAPKK